MLILEVLFIVFGMCLLVTAVGFRKTVWFVSVGYAFSFVAVSAAFCLSFYQQLHWYNWFQIAGILAWGLRLGLFIVRRERNESYHQLVSDLTSKAQNIPLQAKIGVWVSVSVTYTCMFAPVVFATQTKFTLGMWLSPVVYTGLFIMYLGLFIESIADFQKSYYKRSNPEEFVQKGLFSWVRYPNYFGELLVWVGSFIVGFPFYQTWWQWLIVAFGMISIFGVMISSTVRLERKQFIRHRGKKSYQDYIKSVPILFPGLPIYSLQHLKEEPEV
ncbi:steroid 5-alpha reductase family enzyme [Chitinophaga skermanii]|uniref:Steroid 5-alpha reductase family enzyme n=1 Tax=Chitinophaga skermanii TaxID=331697 RepID=A0A327QQP5_9BACT|nr:DUF1295 domain-containing protein [Chitinophaga skermanii]RAJ06571.1 steroid 5-alpha reductase family enzyme [Chitinophaga skermanii]